MYIARELRCIARKALKGFWGLSLGVTLVYMILGGAGGAFNLNFSGGTANQQITSYVENSFYGYYFTAALVVAGILSIVAFLIGGPMRQGLCRYNIDLLTRENQPSFNALFSQFKNFGNAFGLNFMINLFTALWTLLFIIPGIIAAYRYALAPYLMVENPDIGVMEAIRQSKELMKGKKWRLFCLHFSFIGWILLSLLTLGVGLLWVNPYMQAATTAFYLDVIGQRDRMPAPDMH